MKVRYTATGRAEVDEILMRIAADNPAAVKTVAAAIKSAINNLRSFPYIGTATDVEGIYMRIARPYRYLIFYRIMNGTVFIESVRPPARRREIRK